MKTLIPSISITVTFEKPNHKTLFKVKTSKDLYEIMSKLFNEDTISWTEEMIMLCFNKHNEVIGYYKLSKGGTSVTVADPKVIYTIALNSTASSIAIAHNHPAGKLRPSSEDIELTERIKNAGSLLDIKLLDHLIITPDGFYSFDDHGWPS